jgi:hypothetical protein
MTSNAYMSGRKRYTRPQAMLFADNPGTLIDGFYVPTGYEVGANTELVEDPNLLDQFLILSDHNRGDISMSPQRIETRERTINGRMRSYYVGDKLQISTSWSLLPSRSYSDYANFNISTGKADNDGSTTSRDADGTNYQPGLEYTADGGAGGVALLDWYENHEGSFWLYLAYDKYSNFTSSPYNNLNKYNEIIEVYFSSFSYDIVKRGIHDLWNINLSLEEA